MIILPYKFGQTWDALTFQDSWNDLQFGMEGVVFIKIKRISHFTYI